MTHTDNQKVLITGASGFLGTAIVTAAQDRGWTVRAFDRNPGNQTRGVETIVGDLQDGTSLRDACKGVSAIVHAAGLAHVFGRASKDIARFTAVNELGTARVINAAVEAGISNVVLVSSVSVYGRYSGEGCNEDQPCKPEGPYAISKWKGELEAIRQISEGDGSLTILRFATIYGEGDRGNVARLINLLRRGPFAWPGRGLNRKSLIYKTDAAFACVRALDRPSAGVRIYNVSSPPVTMREVVFSMCESLGRTVPRFSVPDRVLAVVAAISRLCGDPGGLDASLTKFLRDDVYDAAKFNSSFHFQPAVPLPEGIRRQVEYLDLNS
jgi:nucleoside-diphosphate-sugar epimerase